jgi:cytidine deaminase
MIEKKSQKNICVKGVEVCSLIAHMSMKKFKISLDLRKTYREAVKVRLRAHAPYSGYRVGSALMIGKRIFAGCNVENASYGGTICAERSALVAAKAQIQGRLKPKFIVVVTANKNPATPCGLCLQFMAEFCADTFPVYLANPSGIQSVLTLGELLPHAFRKEKL